MIMLNGLGSGDALDSFWYNNAFAEGEQTYPSGIHKYYDIYSLEGYWIYLTDYWIAAYLLGPL